MGRNDDEKYSSSSRRSEHRSKWDDERRHSDRDRYSREDDRYHSDRGKYRKDDDRKSSHRSSRNRSSDRSRKRRESRSRSKSPKRKRDIDLDTSIYAASDLVDPNRKFFWKKKEQRDKKVVEDPEERKRKEDRRREENKLEIEKITSRRKQREEERRLMDEEKERQLRHADMQQLGDWEARETQFHLEQAKRRAEIRIRDNRAEPIDVLAIHLKLSQTNKNTQSAFRLQEEDEDFELEIEVKEPYLIFDNLPLHRVEALQKDIRMYLTLETDPESLDFWSGLMIVCDDKLAELRAGDLPLLSRVPEEVMNRIHNMLVDKDIPQLDILEKDIEAKLTSSHQVNTDFWEQVLKSLKIWRAKLKLRIRHEQLLEIRLEQLRSKQLQDAEEAQRELEKSLDEARKAITNSHQGSNHNRQPEDESSLEFSRDSSPELFDLKSLPVDLRDLPIIDPVEDYRNLKQARQAISSKVYVPKRKHKPVKVEKEEDPDQLTQKELNQLLGTKQIDHEDMELDEEIFDAEMQLAKATYQWEDKYRPRKPKYVNRVHTGFEWNKYNQTHYDIDNPPPRIVQGYKFNIFYPDLIHRPSERISPPTYKLERDPESDLTEIIRFIAGPPYEDIAFKIVKRSWERSHRNGFKCTFDRGVLQLHFFFKRQFYRR